MKKNLLQKKPGLMVAITLVGVIVANVLLNFQWFETENVQAFNLSADEQFANNTPTQNDSTPQTSTDIATDANGNSVIVWESDTQAPDSNSAGIFFRRFDSKGNALTTNSSTNDQIVNTTYSGAQTDPAVTMDKNGNFVIAWAGNGSGDTNGVFIQAFNSDGLPVGSETRVNTTTTGDQRNPGISLGYMNGSASGVFTVAWESCSTGCQIYTQSYTINFTAGVNATTSGVETGIDNNLTSTDATNPAIAVDNTGDFAVVWDGTTTTYTTDRQVFGDISIAGSLNGNVKINNATTTPATKPSIALPKNSANIAGSVIQGTPILSIIVAYQGTSPEDTDGGIFAKTMSVNNFTMGPSGNTELTINSTTTGLQINPDVSSDQISDFTVAWEDDTADSDGKDIYAQNYKSINSGLNTIVGRVDQQFRVNSAASQPGSAPNDQIKPAVTMTPDGFYTISYSNRISANNTDVKFQPFVSEMLRSSSELHQNQTGTNLHVDVAMSPNGLYATVWADTTDNSLKFTLRDSNNANAIIGTAGTIIDNATWPISRPSVSFYTDTRSTSPGYNRFIVAWEGSNGVDQDIYYREVDGTGTPVGISSVVNTITAGNQVIPDIAAANYGADSTTRRFAVTWLEDSNMDVTNESVYSSYLEGSTFSENLLTSTCLQCMNTRVAIDNASNNIVYVWDDSTAATNDIVFRKATGGTLQGVNVGVTTGNGVLVVHHNPDVTFLGYDNMVSYTNKFLISYDDQNGTGNNLISAKTYNFSTGYEVASTTVSTGINNFNGKVSAQQGDGTGNAVIFFVWNTFPIIYTNDNTYGTITKYDLAGNTFKQFTATPMRVNATQEGAQFVPSVSMNSTGKIVVGWEGEWQSNPNQTSTTTDTGGAMSQLLNNPAYMETTPSLTPEAQQQINQGARTLSVPDTILFSSTPVNPSTGTIKTVSVRDNVYGGGNLKYFEVQDLLGNPFNVTIIADTDFVNSTDGQSYIMRSNFAVRNWDQDITNVDTTCPGIITGCFLTIEPTVPPIMSTFNLDASTTTFRPLNTSQTLVNKTGTDIGKWRWYPDFQLTIPALTPPGNHTVSVTATLN